MGPRAWSCHAHDQNGYSYLFLVASCKPKFLKNLGQVWQRREKIANEEYQYSKRSKNNCVWVLCRVRSKHSKSSRVDQYDDSSYLTANLPTSP